MLAQLNGFFSIVERMGQVKAVRFEGVPEARAEQLAHTLDTAPGQRVNVKQIEADLQKLIEAFAPIRDHIATFDNSNYLTALPNGEICAANNWSGDYGVAKARAEEAGIDINLGYFVPKTGAPAWFDFWCIPADAQNVDNAYLFIDYLLRPEVIAAATNYTGYANANKAATPLVDPAIAADPAVYPDAETMSRLYTPKPQTEEQETALNRAWTAIKTGG